MVIALTIVFAAIALVVGRGSDVEPVVLVTGQPAPQEFLATASVSVVDVTATEAQIAAAVAAIPDQHTEDDQATEAVLTSIQAFFADAELVAQPTLRFPSEPDDTFPTLPETTTTTAPDPDATTTSSTSSTTTTTTEPPTTTTTTTTTLPPTTGTGEETTTSSTTTTATTTTTLPPPSTTTTIAEPPVQVFPPLSSQLAELRALYPLLRVETIQAMVVINNEDRVRVEAGVQPLFRLVEQETVTLAQRLLQDGIRPNELGTVRADLVTDPPPLILLRPLPDDQQAPASQSVADLVAVSLQANEILDAGGTEALRAQAAASVPDVTIDFVQGEAIVRAGQRVTDVQLQAIEMLGLLQPEGDPVPLRALASVAGLMVIIASFYLWRLGRSFWAQPKMVALFGLLMVLAAVAARVPDIVTRDRRELGFMLPAAMFGYLAAHLFDSRVAVLLAIPMAAFTAVGTGDLALTVFAAAATLAPLPLVSSVSSRAQLNTAVILSAVLHAPLAGVTVVVLLRVRLDRAVDHRRRRQWPRLGGGRTRHPAVSLLHVRHYHHSDAARPHRPQPSSPSSARRRGARYLQSLDPGGEPRWPGCASGRGATRYSRRRWPTTTTSARRRRRSTSSKTSSACRIRMTFSRPRNRRPSFAVTLARGCDWHASTVSRPKSLRASSPITAPA